MSYMFRQLIHDDWEEVKAVYLEGIRTGNATFQTEAPSKEQCLKDMWKSVA